MMSDMSRCPHGDAVGYCDICSPGWEMELIKSDAQDKIFSRGIELGRKELEQQLAAEREAHEETKRKMLAEVEWKEQFAMEIRKYWQDLQSSESKLAERDAQIAKSREQEPKGWIYRHINDHPYANIEGTFSKSDAEKWVTQYKVGFAWLENLYPEPVIPPSTAELIEQARREENEACRDLCRTWNTTPGRRLAELIEERLQQPERG